VSAEPLCGLNSCDVKKEAESLRLGLLAGVVSVTDVISWADSAIAAADKPHISLIEIALSVGGRAEDIARQLEMVPGHVDPLEAFRNLLSKFASELDAHPENAWEIARRLYQLASQSDWPETALGMEPYSLDDNFDLAAQGSCTFEDARAALRSYLAGHARPSPAA
jgi:hypothetical protein